MKKMMTVGCAALMAAGIAGAQGDMDLVGLPPAGGAKAQPEVTAEAALLSSYVWRGQVYNNDMVIQPQITVSQYGVSLNAWGNYNIGKDTSGVSSDFSEIDFTLAYNLPINLSDMQLAVGATHYTFPNTMSEATTEVFVTGSITTWDDLIVPVIPAISVFGDVDEVKGTYVLLELLFPYEVTEYLSAEGGISAGYGNTSYNDYYFPNGASSTQDAGWNDYNFKGIVNYAITEDVTASLSMVYTMLEGGSIRSAADKIYDDKEKFWVGANIAYDF